MSFSHPRCRCAGWAASCLDMTTTERSAQPSDYQRPAPESEVTAQLDLAAAWRRLSTRHGLPGVDGVDACRFARRADAELAQLRLELDEGSYRPLPLRSAVLESPGERPRSLAVPAMRDRVCRSAMADWLARQFDQSFDEASYAFRKGRGVHAALRAVTALRDRGLVWVLHADVKKCFESIPHVELLAAVRYVTGDSSTIGGWVRDLVHTPVWDGRSLCGVERGVAQGCPLSPWLANALLDVVDRQMRGAGRHFVRYADDMLLMARSSSDLASAATHLQSALALVGLELNTAKLQTTSFVKGFRFLGARIEGDDVWMPFGESSRRRATMNAASLMPSPLLRAYRNGYYHPAPRQKAKESTWQH